MVTTSNSSANVRNQYEENKLLFIFEISPMKSANSWIKQNMTTKSNEQVTYYKLNENIVGKNKMYSLLEVFYKRQRLLNFIIHQQVKTLFYQN